MVSFTKEVGVIGKETASAFKYGPPNKAGVMRVTGKTIRCMGRANSWTLKRHRASG